MKYVLALGFFDGVHIGHAAIMQKAVKTAREKGLRAAAVTFDRPPKEVITGVSLPLITTLDRRCEIITNEFDMQVFVLPFDKKLMNTDWREFADHCLIGSLHAVHLVFGRDFRFGRKGAGTAEMLCAFSREHAIGCDIMDKITHGGQAVGSTRIRKEIAHGRMDLVSELLGRPFELKGIVIPGRRLGGKLGFPTLNIRLPEELVKPADGVYHTRVSLWGREYDAVSNCGLRPTVDGRSRLLESHLLGFQDEAYGSEITVRFISRIRGEIKFSDTDALRAQVLRDIETVAKEV